MRWIRLKNLLLFLLANCFRVLLPSLLVAALFLVRHQLHYILVLNCMRDTHTLRLVLSASAPDQCVLKTFVKIAMDSMANVLNRGPAPHDQWLIKGRLFTTGLGEDTKEIKVFPDLRQQPVDD